eukprot:SM003327S12428  [mRNA]  locus=s3327:3:1285:- [translate_table: standard]
MEARDAELRAQCLRGLAQLQPEGQAESLQVLRMAMAAVVEPLSAAWPAILLSYLSLTWASSAWRRLAPPSQRQVDDVRAACEAAERIIADARKAHGLGRPAAGSSGGAEASPPDKKQLSRAAEQEKLLRMSALAGEGLRLPAAQLAQQRQQVKLPPHLARSPTTAAPAAPPASPSPQASSPGAARLPAGRGAVQGRGTPPSGLSAGSPLQGGGAPATALSRGVPLQRPPGGTPTKRPATPALASGAGGPGNP